MPGLDDPFLAMVHGAQALRRRVERDRCAILGALGVAAEPLPHQIANVIRILKAPELRFLIADEVGLGKTIQTMMVLNVLRLRDQDHKTLLIVPDHLVYQWCEELATRGHLSAYFADTIGEADEMNADSPVHIARPSQITDESELLRTGPDLFDLLVLDEPQTFTVEQRNALARARPFAQFMALTATPEFRRKDMQRWFLKMLEPLRSEAAENPLDWIRDDEKTARRDAENGALSRELAFERDALGRRVCRWERKDWPDYMPKRSCSRMDIQPFAQEAFQGMQAQKLVDAHLNVKMNEDRHGIDLIARARRLHRVGRSSRVAREDLPESYRLAMDEESSESNVQGDSRFDALLSYLARLWSRDRDARVLIVAGDNDTVNRLKRLLPRYFPDPTTGEALGVSDISRVSENVPDSFTAFRQSHENLGNFTSGDDKVLLIGDWVEAGLNLHYTCKEIVFYSCPWDVKSIDQLIGRLDRLRRNAGKHATLGKNQGRIGIHVLSWAGSPEAQVIDGLEKLKIFDRPMPPVTEETGRRIEECLHMLAAGKNTDATLKELGALGEGQDINALSDIAHFSPYTAKAARDAHDERRADSFATGAFGEGKNRFGRVEQEDSLKAWLFSLDHTRLIDFRHGVPDKSDEKILHSTAWYYDTGARHNMVTRPFLLEDFERQRPVCFNLHRYHLSDPPRRFVERRNQSRLVLDYLDHGNPLHEQLCDAFLKIADKEFKDNDLKEVLVEYPPGHPALNDQRSILITVALRCERLPIVSSEEIDALLNRVDKRDKGELERIFRAMIQADDRWFSLACPPRYCLDGVYVPTSGADWENASDADIIARLDPRKKDGRVRYRRTIPLRQNSTRLEAKRRKTALMDSEKALGVEGNEIDVRLELVQAELDRMLSDAARRAQQMRNRIADDENQRRMTESVAQRIERRIEAVQKFTIHRHDRIKTAKAPPPSPEERCWRIVVRAQQSAA